MATTWVVVANRSRARIFARPENSAPLQDIEDIIPGHSIPDREGRRKSIPKEADEFAEYVADRVALARKAGEFDAWYLVGEPEFVDLMNSDLDSATRKKLQKSIRKDLAGEKLSRLREKLTSLIR